MTTTTTTRAAQTARRSSSNEAEAMTRINEAVAEAQKADQVIDRDTARLIASAVHRGIGGELEHFAATGQLVRHQVARLELFHATSDEPAYTTWRTALRRFITWDERTGKPKSAVTAKHRHRVRPGDQVPTARGRRHGSHRPTAPLPSANPDPENCDSCDPQAAVVYVRSEADHADQRRRRHHGLALHTQAAACRRFVRDHLHKRLEATFADRGSSWLAGFRKLLTHLRICHNRRVIVHRLDRLPTAREMHQIRDLDARVLSASQPNLRATRPTTASVSDPGTLSSRRPKPKRRKHGHE